MRRPGERARSDDSGQALYGRVREPQVRALSIALELDPDGFPMVSIPLSARPHPGLGTGAEVWLLRHGEVHADWHGRAYGGMDVPLSERGLEQTEERARSFAAIPFRAVVSSNLSRARALGERLAALTGAPLSVHAELAEIRRGEWQGQRIADLFKTRPDEVAGFYADPWNFHVPGGENDADVLGRVLPVFEAALRRHGGPLAVTAHYNVIRVLVAHLLGIAPEHSFGLRVDLSSACCLRDGRGGWVLERSNVRAPLAIAAATP